MISVVKMHGTHNEFVLIDERPPHVGSYPELAKTLCDRTEGLGADGLLVVGDAPGFAAEMRIFNADGSEAEMCGNGVRCVARYLAGRGAGDRFVISTLAGPIETAIVTEAPEYLIRVDMGAPALPNGTVTQTITAAGQTWRYLAVSLGNPHVVIFVDDVDAVDLTRTGRELATDARFSGGTNVHFAQVLDPHDLRVVHYERGVGPTQSCGTGAVACAAAAVVAKRAHSPVSVRVPGGVLEIEWEPGKHAFMTGPAVTVFERAIEHRVM
ncbi:MAG TPA: diaminopimelate epimerase [Candidatus Acidoferrales bacterium]|nr:diaminopimelate epimerase [Candidatus Acidoferrales bacterium]